MLAAEAVTQKFRQQSNQIRARTLNDLSLIWPLLDWTKLDLTFPGWEAAALALITRERRKLAMLTVGYVTEYRLASKIPGGPHVRPAADPPIEQLRVSLRVTSVVAVKVAMRNGMQLPAAVSNAFVRSSGAVTRHVLDAGRDTVRASVLADPRARGWRRVTSGRACAFCLPRATAVHSHQAQFRSHDHCSCTAEPVYI